MSIWFRNNLEDMRRWSSSTLTLLSNQVLKEALLIVSFSDDIYKQVVLLPQAVDLIVLVFNYGALSVPSHALLDVLLLSDVLAVSVREGRSQIC